MPQPLRIDHEDLARPEVDAAIAERSRVAQTKAHYESAQVPATAPQRHGPLALLLSAPVWLGLLGLVGGLIGWGIGAALPQRADERTQAISLANEWAEINQQGAAGVITPDRIERAREDLRDRAANNRLAAIQFDYDLSADQKTAATAVIETQLNRERQIRQIILFAIAGLCVAAALSAAESLSGRNYGGAMLNGTAGAVFGLLGGVAAAMLSEATYESAIGGTGSDASRLTRDIGGIIAWGILGAVLATAPGFVMGSAKRVMVGAAGGLVGGLLGGTVAIFMVGEGETGRLTALASIGLLAGVGVGLIEQAIKDGWLYVQQGVIAGKQFVLYRNPTYIGSAPLSHIYLFNDAQVGKRHAALHQVQGGYEIENLPLGGPTLVNSRPVARTRLKSGDVVSVGQTTFVFQERTAS